MLNLLRRYVKPRRGGPVLHLPGPAIRSGHGFMDAWARKMGEQTVGKTETIRDFTRDDPLKQALYSEEYARVCGGHRLASGPDPRADRVRPAPVRGRTYALTQWVKS